MLAAIYCSLGRFEEAVPVLDRAIRVPEVQRGSDHALAAFSGHMQLGDTYSMLGQVDRSIECYEEGLKIQIEALGDTDPRVGETCRSKFRCFLLLFSILWVFVHGFLCVLIGISLIVWRLLKRLVLLFYFFL